MHLVYTAPMPVRPPALTAAQAHRLKPRAARYEVRDGDAPGLVLRIEPTGTKRWGFRAREHGELKYMPLGDFPKLSLAAARIRAREVRARLDAGERPFDDRVKRRSEPTLGELFAQYQASVVKGPRSRIEDARRWARRVEPWANRRAGAVTREEAGRFLDRIAKDSFFESNRVMALLRHLYGWAIEEKKIRGENPWRRKKKPEHARERAILPDEMRKLLDAIDAEPDAIWCGYFRLLLLTGCRRTELLSARWEWLRREQTPPVLALPRTATKQGREHHVMLSTDALANLDALPRDGSPYIFPGGDGGPRVEPKRAWERIRQRSGIADIRIHDLRHALGSSLGSAQVNAFIIKRALGHSQLATTDRYVHPEVEATHRALEDHAARLRALRAPENTTADEKAD